jgi:hypothetical protein
MAEVCSVPPGTGTSVEQSCRTIVSSAKRETSCSARSIRNVATPAANAAAVGAASLPVGGASTYSWHSLTCVAVELALCVLWRRAAWHASSHGAWALALAAAPTNSAKEMSARMHHDET